MKLRSFTKHTLIGILLGLILTPGFISPPAAQAQWAVFDPSNYAAKLEEMQREMQDFIEYVEREFASRSPELNQKIQHALVKVTPPHVTVARPRKPERH